MIVPPASLVAPLMVAVSLIAPPIVAPVALVANEEQFVMFTRWGETKSFSSAENDVDERLFRYADPNEPHVPPALRDLDNVVLTPHMASATHETRQAMADLALANLQAHFAGRPLHSPVPECRAA